MRYREWYGATRPQKGLRLTAEEVGKGIKDRSAGESYAYSVLDPAAFAQDGGPSIAERLIGAGAVFRRADNSMTKYLRSPEMHSKIAAIMPTRQAAESWLRRLDFEVGLSELTAQSLGNSATARRLAQRQDAEGVVGDLIADALAGSGTASLWRRLVMAAPRKARDAARARSDRVLADLLTNPQPQASMAQVLRELASAPPKPSMTAEIATAAGLNAALLGR